MAALLDRLTAMQVALINNPALRAELFRCAKEAAVKHGLIVYVCDHPLQPVADSILVNKTFSAVPGFVFAGIPIRLLGPALLKFRNQLLSLAKGKLPIIFTENVGKDLGILTISERMSVFSEIVFAMNPSYKKQNVLVDWNVILDYQFDEKKIHNRMAQCVNCRKTGELKCCSGCRGLYYCGAVCQNADWKRHKPECPTLATLCSPNLKWFD